MPDSILIRGGTILPCGDPPGVLTHHGIRIENGTVSAIAPLDELANLEPAGEVIDAHGKLVMPGLINGHMHFYSTLVRGLGKARPSANFNEVLENLWWRLDRQLSLEDVYSSALVALIASIRKGTTTLIDHHSSQGGAHGSLAHIARAVKETGLRACLCYELSDRDGVQAIEDGLQENVDFIRQTQKNDDDQLKALFGLHASFTVSERTLARAVEEATSLGVGFHVHTAEAESDQQHCLSTFGVRVVERFRRAGVLRPGTICAHGVHLDDAEIDILAESGTFLVHNPQSNMNNGVGAPDVLKLSSRGVMVGLGTDAMTVNMFETLRCALWLQRLIHRDPSCGFGEIHQALLAGNRQIANTYWNCGLGRIQVGAAADIILVDYFSPTPLDASTAPGHLYFGAAESAVDTTIVRGQVLMKDKQLRLGLDEERIAARACELAKALWERF